MRRIDRQVHRVWRCSAMLEVFLVERSYYVENV